MSQSRFTPPTRDQVKVIFNALGLLIALVPEKHRTAVTAGLASLAILVGIFYGGAAIQYDQPAYLATGVFLTSDGTTYDANVQVREDGAKITRVSYDSQGHGRLPKYEVNFPGTGVQVPAAPLMGWRFPAMVKAIAEQTPLKISFEELRAFDQANPGAATEAQARLVLNAVWDHYQLAEWQEVTRSDRPDIIFGMTAGQDCSMPDGAVGCAAWQNVPFQHMRITANGEMYRGAYGYRLDNADVLATFDHEIGHFFDLDHTDCNHQRTDGHVSKMSPIDLSASRACAGGYIGEFHDYTTTENTYGLTRRTTPRATPPPTGGRKADVVVSEWKYNAATNSFDSRELSRIAPVIREQVWLILYVDGRTTEGYPFIEVLP